MPDYALAEAFVQIRPDTTGFRAEAESKIKAALAGINPEVKVKVTPDLSGFQAAVKAALTKALAGTGGKIPIKLTFDTDAGDLARQIALLRTKLTQQGLADFLDADLPLGKIQYQVALLRRLLQQGKVTDFLGVNLNQSEALRQGAALRSALKSELSDVNIGVGVNPASAAAAKAAAMAALGSPGAETSAAAAAAATGGLAAQAADASADAQALLRLAASAKTAGDAAKYAYAANIAQNIALKDQESLAAPVADAMNTMAGRWGVLTNRLQLFGGALAGVPILAQVALWHVLADTIIETIAVILPATIAFVAFGAAAAPTAQHIYVQLSNIWTASNALNQSIYPLTKNMMSLGNAVKPEVYQLFGQALVVANDKAGEFSKTAAEAGKVIDQLGARASAALVSGGFSQFLAKGPQDLMLIGDIIGNIFGIVGNLLRTMPGYAQILFGTLRDVTGAIEAVTATPLAQWLIKIGLYLHGAILYGGLAVTSFVLIGNALGALAARFGIADAAALSFDASLFSVGIRGALTGIGELAVALFTMAGAEDVAAASSDILAGSLAALDAVNPVFWVVAAAAAIAGVVYWLTRATSATSGYDAAVNAALQQVPVNQLQLQLTREMAITIGNMQDAQAQLAVTSKTLDQVNLHTGQTVKQTSDAWRQQAAIVAGYQGELATLQGYQANYNELLKAAGGNMALIVAAGITTNNVIGASSSQMAQNIIMVQAEVAQFKAMELGVGRAGAAMNALNYAGDTTNNTLGSLDVDMQKIVTGQDDLTNVILGGEQAFIGFQQAVGQWGTDLGKSASYLHGLVGETTNALTAQNDFYSTVLPDAGKLVDALEMQLAPTNQITVATATSAKEMLALAGNNALARGVIISFINNALGPGTVGFQNLNKWVAQNSTTQQGFQAIIAESTINAAKLGGTINSLTQSLFTQDLMLASHVTPDMKAYASALVNQGANADATRGARAQLIKDYESIGLSAQAATALVNGLTQGLEFVPKVIGTSIIFSGGGTISVSTGLKDVIAHIGRTGLAGGTTGASPGWTWVGEKGPELAYMTGGETVIPNHAIGGLASGVTGNLPQLTTFVGAQPGAVQSAASYTMDQKAASVLQTAVGLVQQAQNTLSYPAGPVGGAIYALEQYAASLFPRYGWQGQQILPLGALWTRESGWNRFARNPSSGAYGIAQALPPTKYPFAGQAAGGSSAAAQIAWGEQYIASRYGTPASAWAHEVSVGWYDSGGWLMPGATVAINRTGKPERVSPPGGATAGELSAVTSRLDRLIALMSAAPAANASALARSLNTSAGSAVTKAMYPNRAGAGR